MELPQPHRIFGTEGKSPTHDFLSPYNDPSFRHQDPRPSSQGFYVKTRDFLEPLERVGDSNAKGEGVGEISTVEKAASVEHVLPGGIGTYSISHISSFEQRVVKPERKVEGDCNNRTSYGGGAFTLWEESMVKDKGLVKDNVGERRTIRGNVVEEIGRWSSERHSQPFISRSSFSPISSSMQPVQKNQGFMEMMKCVKGALTEDDEDEEEEYVKKEGSSHKGDSSVKLGGKGNDQRANTPRSKHSATEQRRRSKINDRFQILRELIPHNDQKRDKASFLLEVIEYIQLLQEKVHKYEASYQGWNQEIRDNVKLSPWKNSQATMADHPRDIKNGPGPGFMFAGKFDNNSIAGTTPSMPTSSQTPAESENMSTGVPFKTMDHNPGLANKEVAVPLSLHQNMYPSSVGRSSGFTQPQQRLMSDAENMASQPPSQLWQRFGSNDYPVNSSMPNQHEELTVEGGTISISSVYSQGLLSTLTQALQTSGVDLSQASISVQIDLGKRANTRPSATTTSSAKDHEDPSSSNRAMAQSRVASSAEDSEQSKKRLRTENS